MQCWNIVRGFFVGCFFQNNFTIQLFNFSKVLILQNDVFRQIQLHATGLKNEHFRYLITERNEERISQALQKCKRNRLKGWSSLAATVASHHLPGFYGSCASTGEIHHSWPSCPPVLRSAWPGGSYPLTWAIPRYSRGWPAAPRICRENETSPMDRPALGTTQRPALQVTWGATMQTCFLPSFLSRV